MSNGRRGDSKRGVGRRRDERRGGQVGVMKQMVQGLVDYRENLGFSSE